MTVISDEYMQQMLQRTRQYCIVILRKTPLRYEEGADEIVWEHGRRNFELRAEGKVAIVCPINDGSDVSGVKIMNTSVEEARQIMEDDPGIKAGIFTYEVHPCRIFPCDSLPA